MDHYEELGISPTASQDEIHRAHRRLTKLLHPDQQTDKAMKLLAETQMRRLNAIVEVLSDPDQRRQYDYSLTGSGPVHGVKVPEVTYPQRFWKQRLTARSLPWWVGSTIAAIVLIIGVVWFWAYSLGSSFGVFGAAYTSSQVQDKATDSTPTASRQNPHSLQSRPSGLSRLRNALLPSRPTPKPSRITEPTHTRAPEIKHQSQFAQAVNASPVESQSLVAVVPNRPLPQARGNSDSVPIIAENRAGKSLNVPTATVPAYPISPNIELTPPPSIPSNASPKAEAGSLPLPALPVAIAPKLPQPAKPMRQGELEGEWVYTPREPEKRKPGFYPPEFIHLKLFWNDGALHGQYLARYQITDKPISPDVSFVLSPADKEARKFVWQSENGSRGIFKINSIDPGSIRVEWRTTVFGQRTTALTAGIATLVRRSP